MYVLVRGWHSLSLACLVSLLSAVDCWKRSISQQMPRSIRQQPSQPAKSQRISKSPIRNNENSLTGLKKRSMLTPCEISCHMRPLFQQILRWSHGTLCGIDMGAATGRPPCSTRDLTLHQPRTTRLTSE